MNCSGICQRSRTSLWAFGIVNVIPLKSLVTHIWHPRRELSKKRKKKFSDFCRNENQPRVHVTLFPQTTGRPLLTSKKTEKSMLYFASRSPLFFFLVGYAIFKDFSYPFGAKFSDCGDIMTIGQ